MSLSYMAIIMLRYVCTLLLSLSLDCWHMLALGLTGWGLAANTVDRLCGWPHGVRVHFSEALVPAESALQVSFTELVGWCSEASYQMSWFWVSWEVPWCRPRSPAFCLGWDYLVGAITCSMVGCHFCAGFRGTWKRPCCKLRPATASARLRTLW